MPGLNILLLLIITALLRLGLAVLFPLTADEAYYWLWSKHLSLSYVDHPPMVALINFISTSGKESLLGIRLGAVFLCLLITFFIYLISKELFNEKVAFWSALLFNLIPHYLIIWLTMFVELPLALFWSISLYLLVKIVKTKNSRFWLLLGITLGLGSLSKYTIFLFWPCLCFFFWLSTENRFWIGRKEPYLCLILNLFFFLPVIFWNSQQGWVSFLFHGGKSAADRWGINFLPFVADQLVHFTPFLIFLLFPIYKYAKQNNTATRLLFSFSYPILFLFLLLTLKIKVWAHWPSIAYLSALPLAVNYLTETHKSLRKFLAWISLFTLITLIILFSLSSGILPHQKDYAKNYALPSLLPPNLKIFSKTNVSSALLEFYSKRPAYLAAGFLKTGPLWGEKQYELWGIPRLEKGEDILYYGEEMPAFQKYFQKATPLNGLRLYLIEDYIGNHYKFFRLEGFRGSHEHP
jgi:4-amino-4-deoxy-L-arabinose transferase-like glycosyltransferase